MNTIEIKNITHKFGPTMALDDINISFAQDKIYGLLGRNGAGKSTLLNLITNRLFPLEGEIHINQLPAQENDRAQSQVYLMSEKNLYPDSMRIGKAFQWTKNFYPEFDMDYAVDLTQQFHLDMKKKIKSLSTGYNTIFKLIIALSVNTPYLLLDEPVLGLDANHRELFYKLLLNKYSSNPCTIIISTHLIEEVAGLIEDIVIIDKGKVIRSESCESSLSKGYSISGKASSVDSFIVGKEVIGIDVLGGLKTAHIMGQLNSSDIPDDLEATRLDLQKLFVKLTNS